MSKLDAALLNLSGLDLLALQDTFVHRLDPRAKVLAALAFIVTVVSYPKYDLPGLAPMALYPVVLATLANLPSRYLLGKLLLASPFALVVGLFNPWMDRTVHLWIGPVGVSGGWTSFASIVLRFFLTLSAALILIATTGFPSVCRALARLKVPRAFTVQLLLLYRYIFVLAQEASRTVKAWSLRAAPGQRPSWRLFGSLAGRLLLRALDRAHRIHTAMLSRGFDGEIRSVRPLHFGYRDGAFVLGWCAFFVAARCWNVPEAVGQAVMGAFR